MTKMTRLQKIARTQCQKWYWASGKQKHPQKRPHGRNPKNQEVRFPHFSFASLVVLNSVTEGPRVEIEYEHELESVPITRSSLSNW